MHACISARGVVLHVESLGCTSRNQPGTSLNQSVRHHCGELPLLPSNFLTTTTANSAIATLAGATPSTPSIARRYSASRRSSHSYSARDFNPLPRSVFRLA